jgi:hypothetical protein
MIDLRRSGRALELTKRDLVERIGGGAEMAAR